MIKVKRKQGEAEFLLQLCAIALLALLLIRALVGCTTPTQIKTLSTATQLFESMAVVAQNRCKTVATKECKTDPCPELEACKKVRNALIEAAAQGTYAAKEGTRFLIKMEENSDG